MNALRPVTVDLTSRGEICIFAEFKSLSEPIATVVLCHGIGEHSERYARFVDQLLETGIATIRFDLRGHGKSGGRPGHVDAFSDYLEDLDRVINHFQQSVAGRPVFLFGHSMGGVIVTQYLLHRAPPCPISGLLLSSPGFIPAVPVPGHKRLLSRLLLPLWPTLRFPSGIRPDQLSSDVVAQRAFRSDPKTYSAISLRWYAEFRRATAECLERAVEITLPVCACVGAADAVVSPEGARRFVDATMSDDKTLFAYDGMLHEPLNERDRDRVCRDMIQWIHRQSARIRST